MLPTRKSSAIGNLDESQIVLEATNADWYAGRPEEVPIPTEFEGLNNKGQPPTVTVDFGVDVVESYIYTPQVRTGDAGVIIPNCNRRPCRTGLCSLDASYGFGGTRRLDGNWPNRGSSFSAVREATSCWSSTINANIFCSWRKLPQKQEKSSDRTGVGRLVLLH